MIAIGIVLGLFYYCLSLIIVGRISTAAHYLLVIFSGMMSFVLAWGDLTPLPIRSISSGFWIPIFVIIIIRFGKDMLPEKGAKKAVR